MPLGCTWQHMADYAIQNTAVTWTYSTDDNCRGQKNEYGVSPITVRGVWSGGFGPGGLSPGGLVRPGGLVFSGQLPPASAFCLPRFGRQLHGTHRARWWTNHGGYRVNVPGTAAIQ